MTALALRLERAACDNVSRFRTTPGLGLTVGLEVPLPADQAKAKTDETRTALRELGMSDDMG